MDQVLLLYIETLQSGEELAEKNGKPVAVCQFIEQLEKNEGLTVGNFIYCPVCLDKLHPSKIDPTIAAHLKQAVLDMTQEEYKFLYVNSLEPLMQYKTDVYFHYIGLLVDHTQLTFKIYNSQKPFFDQEQLKIAFDIFKFQKDKEVPTRYEVTSSINRTEESKLNEKSVRIKGYQKRVQNSVMEPVTDTIRGLIMDYHEKGMSDYAIAKKLNHDGYLTAKNRPFQATTVKRHREHVEDIRNRMSYSEAYTLLNVASKPTSEGTPAKLKQIEVAISPDTNFSLKQREIPKLPVKTPLDTKLTARIYDNFRGEEDPLYVVEFAPGVSLLEFDIYNDTILGPGRYYVELTAEGYRKREQTFTIGAEGIYHIPETTKMKVNSNP